MSALTEYCDREIAKCEDIKNDYPHEARVMNQLITRLQCIKKRAEAQQAKDIK